MKKTIIINALESIGISDTNKLFQLDSLTLQRVAKVDLEKISDDTVKSLEKQIMEIELKPYLDAYDRIVLMRLQQQVKAAKQVLAMRQSALA